MERYGTPAGKIDVVHWDIDAEAFPRDLEASRPFMVPAPAGDLTPAPVILFLGPAQMVMTEFQPFGQLSGNIMWMRRIG